MFPAAQVGGEKKSVAMTGKHQNPREQSDAVETIRLPETVICWKDRILHPFNRGKGAVQASHGVVTIRRRILPPDLSVNLVANPRHRQMELLCRFGEFTPIINDLEAGGQ